MTPTVPRSARPRARDTLANRLLLAQAAVVAAMAVTMVAAAAWVGPQVFHDHMRQAGNENQPDVVAHAEEAFRSAGMVSLGIGLAMAVLGALTVSALLARRIGMSLSAVTEAAERVAAGEYDAPVQTTRAGTELARLATSFNAMSARLASVEATRRRLLTDLAHEMRTPIATLDVCLEGLQDGVVAPDAPTLAALREQTARLARLAQDINDVSAAEEGRLAVRPTALPVSEVVRRAFHGARDGYARKGVWLTVDDAGARPDPGGGSGNELRVRADPDRIGQVLANLLSNALRHTPPGGSVRLGVAADEESVAVTVSDSGDGIAPEHLPHVFERFYRADTARDRDHGGTGVGLAISQAIARAHRGDLAAASDGPGRGASFTLSLPRD